MAKKKVDVSNAQKLGIGVGLTAAAVAAAGAYFLYGSKDAPKNRKMVKGWALKAKGDVLQALEQAENITEKEFGMLVDGVANTYGKVQKLSKQEVSDFKEEMTDSWKGLVKSGVVSAVTAGIAAGAKKASKKVPAKKAPAKKTPTKKVAAKAPAKKAVAKK